MWEIERLKDDKDTNRCESLIKAIIIDEQVQGNERHEKGRKEENKD